MEYIKEIIGLVVVLLGYWFFAKLREFSEKKEGAGAIKALQEVYDGYIAHNKQVSAELIERINRVEKHNIGLQKNFNEVLLNYNSLISESKKTESQYLTLCKEHEKLKIDHESLKLEFEKYKKMSKLNGESIKTLKNND